MPVMTFQRSDHRAADALRPITLTRHYTKHAEGSVLVEFGHTKVRSEERRVGKECW